MNSRRCTRFILSAAFFSGGVLLAGCMSAGQHATALHSEQDRNLTVGTVQREIRRGMSSTSVVESLGSPNIVTRDDAGDETWVYDKIATEASYSSDQGSVAGAGAGGGYAGDVLILGGLFGNYSKAAGASATTQKTLTVVVKFDRSSRVKDFSYHSSKF